MDMPNYERSGGFSANTTGKHLQANAYRCLRGSDGARRARVERSERRYLSPSVVAGVSAVRCVAYDTAITLGLSDGSPRRVPRDKR